MRALGWPELTRGEKPVKIKRPAANLTTFATLGLLVVIVGICVLTISNVAHSLQGAGATSSDLDSSDPITAQRAGYVSLMLSNSYAAGPETQRGIMSVISGYGGGYVTDASLSGGDGPNEMLTVTVVLGGGDVVDNMQGETDFGTSGIACFTYTLGYGAPSAAQTQISCPASLTVRTAQATATRQIAEQAEAKQYDAAIPSKTMPTTLAEAEKLIGLDGPAHASATAGLSAANFATGTDSIQHKPDAALAMPQSGGGCIYVVYRWIQSSWVGGGTAGTADSPDAIAWGAPTDAACTGPAALGAGGFLTMDRDAGG